MSLKTLDYQSIYPSGKMKYKFNALISNQFLHYQYNKYRNPPPTIIKSRPHFGSKERYLILFLLDQNTPTGIFLLELELDQIS